MRKGEEFTIYVVELSKVRTFVLMEIGVGTLVYQLWMAVLHNPFLAGTGGWATTETLKRGIAYFRKSGVVSSLAGGVISLASR